MSYDDGPRRRLGDLRRVMSGGALQRVRRPLSVVVDAARRHVREWPGRYVELRAERYEQ
ncbi:hypothetical protein HALDL1_16720 [Halobacterium sp. DL1]|jgi:hypothetical protein|nr:hypothetical protein HALDL1_16720 [Halobacterium sp. DL1]